MTKPLPSYDNTAAFVAQLVLLCVLLSIVFMGTCGIVLAKPAPAKQTVIKVHYA